MIERQVNGKWVRYVQWCSAVGIEVECDGYCLDGGKCPDEDEGN